LAGITGSIDRRSAMLAATFAVAQYYRFRGSGAWEFYSTPLGDRKPSFDRLIAEIGLSGVASGRQCPLWSYRYRKPGKSGTAESHPLTTSNDTPEPASLLLAGIGLPLVLLVRRRFKKDAVQNNVA